MWDDDYRDEYYPERSERYEVRRVYTIGDPFGPRLKPKRGGKFSTSPTEIAHLTVAYVVLVICFAVALSSGGLLFGFIYIEAIIFMLPIALIAVGLGFVLHELAHKLTAQHYGYWSEFRYDMRGLMMALFFSLVFGFIWAAPGATWVDGRPTKKESGLMSFAGPVINMVIASVFIPIAFILPLDSVEWYYAVFIGFIIGILAVFNMLPIHPLDGAKIWRWNKGVYILGIIIAIAITVFFGLALYTIFIFP